MYFHMKFVFILLDSVFSAMIFILKSVLLLYLSSTVLKLWQTAEKHLLVWYLEEASMGQVPGAGMLDVQVSSVKECSGFCLVVLMWRTQSW